MFKSFCIIIFLASHSAVGQPHPTKGAGIHLLYKVPLREVPREVAQGHVIVITGGIWPFLCTYLKSCFR